MKLGGVHTSKAVAATVAAALALGLAHSATGGEAPAVAKTRAAPRPNVLVIETDDQTQASMSAMPKTRQLIGDQGTTFANSFVNYSLCCPSRSTFLTGEYAHNHRVLGNAPPLGGFDRLDSTSTLPVWLQGGGYYTGLIGKYLNGYENHRADPGGPLIPPGWSEWHGSTVTYDYYGYQLNEGGVLNTYGSLNDNPDNPPDPNLYGVDVYTAKAVDFINRRAPYNQPFFLWLTYLAPHGGGPNPVGNSCAGSAKPALRYLHTFDNEPLPQPPSFNEADVSDKPPSIRNDPQFSPTDLSDIQRFYRCRLGSLLAEDDGVQKLIGALRSNGELDNTVVVFTSDNGFMHGEHRVKTGKVVPYEESIRVPLLIRGPGFPAAKTVGEMAVNADLARTILYAARVAPGKTQDGRALQTLATHPGRMLGRELSIESNGFTGVRTERYIYLQHTSGINAGFIEMYDLRNDPLELQNVASNPAYAGVQAALGARLYRVRTCSGATCRLMPRLWIKLRKRTGPGGCALRPVRARIRGADGPRLLEADFWVNGKRFARDRRRPLDRRVPYGRLKRKRTSKVTVLATLVDGRKLTVERKVHACR